MISHVMTVVESIKNFSVHFSRIESYMGNYKHLETRTPYYCKLIITGNSMSHSLAKRSNVPARACIRKTRNY